MALNQAQRIALRTTLQLLEERCSAVLALLDVPAHPQALLHVTLDLSAENQRELQRQIVQIRSAIAQLAAAYALTPEERSLRQEIAAFLAASWSDLEDTRPAKLRRYGAVDPALVAPLDAAIEQLMGNLDALRAIESERAQGDPIEKTA